MIAAFVVGLREGLESALIVGIIAAFLLARGRRDALKWVWAGVGVAVVLCVGLGVALGLLNSALPGHAQEILETIVALAACAMVTYMILWMQRNAPALRGGIEERAGDALVDGSVWALVAMAFFAVVREGIETVMFLTAITQQSSAPMSDLGGALIGIAAAVALGWGITVSGVRINLGRFMRITSVLLVFIAAGLVATAVGTAHEAGLLGALQQPLVNLSPILHPGGIIATLVGGTLGIQPEPSVAEALGWMLYAVPMILVVTWRKRPVISPSR